MSSHMDQSRFLTLPNCQFWPCTLALDTWPRTVTYHLRQLTSCTADHVQHQPSQPNRRIFPGLLTLSPQIPGVIIAGRCAAAASDHNHPAFQAAYPLRSCMQQPRILLRNPIAAFSEERYRYSNERCKRVGLRLEVLAMRIMMDMNITRHGQDPRHHSMHQDVAFSGSRMYACQRHVAEPIRIHHPSHAHSLTSKSYHMWTRSATSFSAEEGVLSEICATLVTHQVQIWLLTKL